MEYKDFNTLFYSICKIKQNVVKLQLEQLRSFKRTFFQLDFPEWRLQLLWEYVWDDKTYEEIYYIFDKKKLIEPSK